MSASRVNYGASLAALCAAVLATPALGDAKAGIDAWGRGDYKQAVEEWRPAAIAGDADAQFDLGQAYRLGLGVPVDLAMAEQWFGRAAVQGHEQAADNFGLALFQNGKRDQALPWLEKSAARGEPRAQLVLGTMLFNGDVVEKDWARAYALVLRARDAGLPRGATTLAQMDQYIPLDVRQRGMALASQYAASTPTRPIETGAPALTGDKPASAGRKSPPPRQVAAAQPTPRPAPLPPVAPVKPKPVTAATPTTAGGGWRFQVGAFGNQANARGLWQQLHGRVPALAGMQPYYVAAGALTRLQIGSLPSRGEVDRVCGEVKAKAPGTPCVAVAP